MLSLISTETWRGMSRADRSRRRKKQPRRVAFEVVARLANSLGWELMKAEVLRDERERPGDPDARDLTNARLRHHMELERRANKASLK